MHLDRLKTWRGHCESQRGTDHELALVKKSSQDATVQANEHGNGQPCATVR